MKWTILERQQWGEAGEQYKVKLEGSTQVITVCKVSLPGEQDAENGAAAIMVKL